MITINKISTFLLAAVAVIAFSCNDPEDDRLDFETQDKLYIQFSSTTAKTGIEGGSVTLSVSTPLVQQAPTTIKYAVTGAITATGEIVMPADTNAFAFKINIPNNATLDTAKSQARSATVTLTEVDNNLRLGRTDNEAIAVTINIIDNLKTVGFKIDSIGGSELQGALPVIVSLLAGNKAESDITINYSLSGTATEGVDYDDETGGTLVIAAGTVQDTIFLNVPDNLSLDGDRTLKITLDNISTPNNDVEAFIVDDASTYEWTILDDLKMVDVVSTDIPKDSVSASYAGQHSFGVSVAGDIKAKATIHYTITGTGVTDVTEGSLEFFPGGITTQSIVVDIAASAFNNKQQVIIKLTSITSGDDEIILGDDTITLKLKKK